MVSTRNERQSKRRLLSQLDNFDQDIIIGNNASDKQEDTTDIQGTSDQELNVGNPDSSLTVDKNAVNVKTLERCFNERIDREMSHIVDTVEDRIQIAILTTIDSIIAPKIELAVMSIDAHLEGMRLVSQQIGNVGNTQGLVPLLKTYRKEIIHYMC